jgi:hypothetical protein
VLVQWRLRGGSIVVQGGLVLHDGGLMVVWNDSMMIRHTKQTKPKPKGINGTSYIYTFVLSSRLSSNYLHYVT